MGEKQVQKEGSVRKGPRGRGFGCGVYDQTPPAPESRVNRGFGTQTNRDTANALPGTFPTLPPTIT